MSIAKSRRRRWLAAIDVICMIVIALALLADVADLTAYLRNPAAYPIGSEAAGLRYAGRLHFVGMTVGAITLYAIGLVAPALTKDRRRKTAVRLAVALWVLASTAWLMLATR